MDIFCDTCTLPHSPPLDQLSGSSQHKVQFVLDEAFVPRLCQDDEIHQVEKQWSRILIDLDQFLRWPEKSIPNYEESTDVQSQFHAQIFEYLHKYLNICLDRIINYLDISVGTLYLLALSETHPISSQPFYPTISPTASGQIPWVPFRFIFYSASENGNLQPPSIPCPICQLNSGFVRWSRAETTCRSGVPPSSPCQTLFVIGNDSSYVVLLKFNEVSYIKQIAFMATLIFFLKARASIASFRRYSWKLSPELHLLFFLSLLGLS